LDGWRGRVDEIEATNLVTALFDRWYMPLVRYALRSTATYDLAEDLAQDAFMQLYQALRSGKSIEHPKAWTLCVLRRAVTRQLQERFQYEQLDELEVAQRFPGEGVGLSPIQDLLCLLSRREEEVLLLRLEAMKYREIADQLGISMNSVNTLLARALRKLQKAAAEHAVKGNVNVHEKKSLNRTS
jgi:RNA polymerase sigma-70 factor (ECF subfamily)